jgi:para-nitrobenzyl esterase
MSDAQVAEYLRSKTPAEVLSIYKRQFGMLEAPLVFRDGALLPKDDWLDVLARPDGWNHVPVMLGTNRDEYKLFMALDPKHTWKLFGVLPRYRDEAHYQVVAEAVSRAWKALGVDGPAAAMLRSGATDVYAYRFDWRGERRFFGTDLAGMVGAAHGLEIPFVFGHFDMGALKILLGDGQDPERDALSDAMMKYWGTFARDGRPGGAWAEAPGTMLLDVASAGGNRMSPETESLEKIVLSVDSDPRLKTQKDRCGVFHDLAAFRRAEAEETYELAARGKCDELPYAKYPWE